MNYEVERIKELCRKRGWSQYRLAKEMGESNGRINTMLKGKSVPSSSTLRRVCSAFNITMSAFYAEDGIPATPTTGPWQPPISKGWRMGPAGMGIWRAEKSVELEAGCFSG